MRAIVAAVLLSAVGTGCCQTCGSCRSDSAPAPSGYPTTLPAAQTQVQSVGTPAAGTTQAPPAPAGRPVGAYGGTGN
jgi:hypothetical protein